MTIEIRLFGFGDERPPGFDAGNRRSLEPATPLSTLQLLDQVGIGDHDGLIVMRNDRVVPAAQWQQANIVDGDRITLMSAFEGG